MHICGEKMGTRKGYKNLQVGLPEEVFVDHNSNEYLTDICLLFDDLAEKFGMEFLKILDKRPIAEKGLDAIRKRMVELRYIRGRKEKYE